MKDRGKGRAQRNRSIILDDEERRLYGDRSIRLNVPVMAADIENRTINQDLGEVLPLLPKSFVDLLFIDPPYNLNKRFCGNSFRKISVEDYRKWLESWFPMLLKVLKPTASVYICGDWRSSPAIFQVIDRYLEVRNRITWEREKGRGAKRNWKNCSEDIWFCTVSDHYVFNTDAVRLKKRVIAPYRNDDGGPRDWNESAAGKFRLTCPSNIWNDITVPFWSMPENTEHPTQKPEKLLAKIILASSKEGDMVFDPFMGVGTAAVVARKLGRRYVGVEVEPLYCQLAEKRLDMAQKDGIIQGYADGVFWERNSRILNRRRSRKDSR